MLAQIQMGDYDPACFENNEFQLCDVIRVNPVLCGLSHKVLLASTSSTVAFDRVASCPYKVI